MSASIIFNRRRWMGMAFLTIAALLQWYGLILITQAIDAQLYEQNKYVPLWVKPDNVQYWGILASVLIGFLFSLRAIITINVSGSTFTNTEAEQTAPITGGGSTLNKTVNS